MLLQQTLSFAFLATAARSTGLYPRTETCISNSTYIRPALVPVAPATYDGECFYPTADPQFRLSTYTGRWYQLAGTRVPFTAGCECVFAEYGLNANGTVSVFNSCQIPSPIPGSKPRQIPIRGTASAVSPSYGLDGVFSVKFPGPPPGVGGGGGGGGSSSGGSGGGSVGECKLGPNYIVQRYDEVGGWAIVQTSNFATMFLLSRKQERSEDEVRGWLKVAGRLGTDLGRVVRTTQVGCLYT